jgi:hypothetical protein
VARGLLPQGRMPDPREEEELETADADRRFSQENDDRAGRSWHGMNSEIAVDEVGRFEEDQDETVEQPPPPGSDRV